MHSYYDKVRFLLGDYHIDVLLDKRYQALELHPAPQSLGKPSGDIGVVISENSYLKAVAFHNRIDREISLSVIITHSVTGQERYSLRFHLLREPVINRMTGLYIMVAQDNRVVSHIFGQARINMRTQGVDIVEIICRVISLDDISRVNEQHIFRAFSFPDTVHYIFNPIKRLLHIATHICGVEKSAMNIIRGQQGD